MNLGVSKIVANTVHLDDQLSRMDQEVRDIAADGRLLADMDGQLPKLGPKQLLRERHLPPQSLGLRPCVRRVSVRTNHGALSKATCASATLFTRSRIRPM